MNTINSILQQNPLSLALLGLFAAFILWRVVKLAVKVAAILALVLAGYLAYRFLTGQPMPSAQELRDQSHRTTSQGENLTLQSIECPQSRSPARADFGL